MSSICIFPWTSPVSSLTLTAWYLPINLLQSTFFMNNLEVPINTSTGLRVCPWSDKKKHTKNDQENGRKTTSPWKCVKLLCLASRNPNPTMSLCWPLILTTVLICVVYKIFFYYFLLIKALIVNSNLPYT